MSKHRPKSFNYKKVLKEVKGNFVVNAIRSMSVEEADDLLHCILMQLEDGHTWLGRKRRHTGRERFEEMHKVCDVDLVYNYYKVLMNAPRNTNFKNDPDARPPRLPCGSNPDTGTRPSAEVSFMLVGSGSEDRINSYVDEFRDGIESSADHRDKEWVSTFFSRITRDAVTRFTVGTDKVSNKREKHVEKNFTRFVSSPVVKFFSCNKLELEEGQERGTHVSENVQRSVWADITISDEHGVKTFIELKHAGLQFYGDREGFIKPGEVPECNGLHTMIHQGVKYLLVYGVCVCIVSDYNKSYVIELAFDDPEWQSSKRTSIPIRSYSIDLKYSGRDSHLPIQMVLAAIIWHQCHLTEQEKAWNQLSLAWLGVLLRGDTGTVGPEVEAGVNVTDSRTQDHPIVYHSLTPPNSSKSDSSYASSSGPDYTTSSSSGSVSRRSTTRRSSRILSRNPDCSADPNPNPNPNPDPNVDSKTDPNTDSNGWEPITAPNSAGDDEEPKNVIFYKPAYKEYRGITQEFGTSEGINHDVVHFSEYETFSGFDSLQMSIESPAMVLCTTQQNLQRYFPSISLHPYEPQRKVVLKIFDYCHMEDCLQDRKFCYGDEWPESYDEFISSQYKKVVQEIKCYEKIGEYNKTARKSKKINAPFLYDYGNLHLKREGGKTHYEGFFVVLDYAGEEVISITDDQIKVAARQLSKMGKLGIKYRDVTPGNLRVKDGNLMFIDFNSCELNDTHVRNDGAIIELETVRYELSYR